MSTASPLKEGNKMSWNIYCDIEYKGYTINVLQSTEYDPDIKESIPYFCAQIEGDPETKWPSWQNFSMKQVVLNAYNFIDCGFIKKED